MSLIVSRQRGVAGGGVGGGGGCGGRQHGGHCGAGVMQVQVRYINLFIIIINCTLS